MNAANQALATLAFFGVGVNLVLFLTRVLRQDSAEAANNVSKWTGTVYIFSLLGAFLSDSYWGRYLTCTIFQLFFVLVCYYNVSFLILYACIEEFKIVCIDLIRTYLLFVRLFESVYENNLSVNCFQIISIILL